MDTLHKFLVISVIICLISIIYSGFMSQYYTLFGLTLVNSQYHVAIPKFIAFTVVVIDMIVLLLNEIIYGEKNVA